MKTILIATDFSSAADRALDHAQALARDLGDELEICHVHVVSTRLMPPALEAAVVTPSPEVVQQGEGELAARVDRVREAGVACRGYTAFGAPAAEIASRASALRPRLLVVGSQGHSRVRHFLLGSIADELVRKTTACPVLIVPDSLAPPP